jgi:MATE family multidrug resistance protein
MFGALALYAHRGPLFRRYAVFREVRAPDGFFLKRLFRVGWPIGVAYGLEVGLFAVTALLMGTFGTTALAAHQVAIQCAAFTFMVPLGIGMAATVRVGQAVGRGDTGGIRRAGYVALCLACLFMLGTAVIFWTVPEAIVSLYLDLGDPRNAAVVRLAAVLLGIAAVFQLFDGAQVVLVGALRGLEDTRGPMVANFFAYWVIGLTTGAVLGFGYDRGAPGLWWGLVVGLAAAAAMHQARFAYRLRRIVVPGTLPDDLDLKKSGTVISEKHAASEKEG